ncbi:alpha-1,6-mannosyl-glycoprotein beta-1,2-N-acetylglucosaminyltransferase, putative [Pediculus humanus corporis]|uniref:Alpha-1,6-mannosyl-glycoprotein 2-beta-N-acetylglucosaminyltransferase n=1 Tax=Pediculus humanus subsp. corporis TaxID=121224 RepID=E0V922_PEDHC|nr:alpha-1,6-mannosyl-glycoprotein beta-1,2-N-acetylglucosaminyltransferase, putative [Pediculus humanus corporis]EEB09878.1 alpha-1,6-mannosyl-glycoprotein beta-1,2-N-acetylglucosaminyltransferase, putative [Pediculus humanus corporis]
MFIWLHIAITYHETDCDTSVENDSLSFVPSDIQKYLKVRPRSDNSTSNGKNILSVSDIKAEIERYNGRQYVHNEDIFGPLQNDSLIIIVHVRIRYLRHLIVSLAQARDIDTTLLIFSHDFFNSEINDLIQSIDFCKVLQIFYPYSIQTHPNTFPGPSPNDCSRNMTIEEALKKNCVNAEWPDMYSHYREAKFTQAKHHWWWKANRVFSQLEITRYHTGLVLFIEEDHFLAEDFIHVLNLMKKTQPQNCRNCDVFSLGTYHKVFLRNVYYVYSHRIETSNWISSRHNMGMALNRNIWNEIKKCAINFCTYDDYNWDYSLQIVSNTCLPKKLFVMMPRAPRIFHIGECGFHHKKKDCEATTFLNQIQTTLKTSKKYLYPKKLKVHSLILRRDNVKNGNGGWTDLRDHQLCLNISSSSTS